MASLPLFPQAQRLFLYMNWVRWPWYSGPLIPDPWHYGFSSFGSRSINVTTEDGELLRGWHIVPRSRYVDKDKIVPVTDFSVHEHERVIIYSHGNAANRAMNHRVHTCQRLAGELNAHVISVDYRGFGDSSGFEL